MAYKPYHVGIFWMIGRTMLLLGYDIGSSAIKASLVDGQTGKQLASARSPSNRELTMDAPEPGWAEQDPDVWWDHIVNATTEIRQSEQWDADAVAAIGLAYQMHGLVLVDQSLQPLRPAIIWCDSRAVDIGNKAYRELGKTWCLENLLNSPGNFTAAKLAWVKRHQPDIYEQAYWAMLPGDYIALKMTGEARTSYSGLSEGALWNVKTDDVAKELLDHLDLDRDLIPEAGPCFGESGRLTEEASGILGLPSGVPISYRAGDQPNNAFSMGVLRPGQAAANAGTSGVVYAVSDTPRTDETARVNSFLHVNHASDQPSYGTLMCVNGTGILNRWIREQIVGDSIGYDEMNELAEESPVGARGLHFLPYGNGAERTLGNRTVDASLCGIRLNDHTLPDILRATQEGIVFALRYGCDAMHEIGVNVRSIRAPRSNMFLSPLFADTFATVLGATLELVETDGARGAALGAGIGIEEVSLDGNFVPVKETITPDYAKLQAYERAYDRWIDALSAQLMQPNEI